MPDRSSKRPRDPNQLAKLVVDLATGAEGRSLSADLDSGKDPAAVSLGRRGGLMALVEITSLRRKVDSRIESVGGPVDVAIISKGDGFVWTRRKFYFDIEKNSDFMYRKFGKGGGRDGEVS